MLFADDCALATCAYVLETVRGVMRDLKKTTTKRQGKKEKFELRLSISIISLLLLLLLKLFLLLFLLLLLLLPLLLLQSSLLLLVPYYPFLIT